MRRAPVIIVPLSNKEAYLDRYAEPDKGWTNRDEAHWPVPYWHIDTGMASLLILQTAVDEWLGACFFGIPRERVHCQKWSESWLAMMRSISAARSSSGVSRAMSA